MVVVGAPSLRARRVWEVTDDRRPIAGAGQFRAVVAHYRLGLTAVAEQPIELSAEPETVPAGTNAASEDGISS